MSQLLNALKHLEPAHPELSGRLQISNVASAQHVSRAVDPRLADRTAEWNENAEYQPATAGSVADPTSRTWQDAAVADSARRAGERLDEIQELIAAESASPAPSPTVPHVRSPAPHSVVSASSTRPLHAARATLSTPQQHRPADTLDLLFRSILEQFAEQTCAAILFVVAGGSHEAGIAVATLAQRMASSTGDAVLLVDADFPGAELSCRMGTANAAGLLDILTAQSQATHCTRTTNSEGLSFLPAGHVYEGATGASSSHARSLVRELHRQFRLILIYGGAAHQSSVKHLATACDGTYLLVEQGIVSDREAQKAKRSLESVRARLMGCITLGAV